MKKGKFTILKVKRNAFLIVQTSRSISKNKLPFMEIKNFGLTALTYTHKTFMLFSSSSRILNFELRFVCTGAES